ncbi:ty3-gypsy retrotransposon protein [Cucumis melo var. makuwa]|uniref:Ty3-gypsy retrotransposon protein n=1 Tax=Cucumis melo var. makuwa TaxID=1194695 RepID=A0A5D3C0N7_CUCMM|nr:ty3-gypsy retrotransposon protein [Cucumis melo var. makuwa]TYK04732.1 ty3-gypsy retrotransposon protein [Cucumis melo var. makuwa]
MTSQGNTSKALSDIGKRPNTRSRSREIQSSEDMPLFEVAKNIWEQISKPPKSGIVIKENLAIDEHNSLPERSNEEMPQPNIMSVIVTDVDTSEDRMTELEKKVNMLMRTVEERDFEIASLKNHIESRDAADSRNTFDWYTDLEPESIDSWKQLERDFLNHFYSARRIVSMIELTATKQRKGESVIDYINRWRALSLDCKDRLTELSAVEMCTQGMHWELLYILQGIKPRTFEELATRAHDMELSIANRGNNDLLVPEVRKEKKEVKSTQKVLKGATKEAMVVSTTPLKLVSKEKKMKKRQDEGKKRRPTLKERQEKIYPFSDSDLPDMLDQLLEKQLIQLPECKRPAKMGRVNDPNYCKYHRVISHPVEKCFVLKELILKLALDKKNELEVDDVAQTNHAAVIIQSDSRLSAIGNLIQFGSLKSVVIYSSPEDLQNNDFQADGPKEEEKQVDNIEEGWTLVMRRKKRKQSFFQKESGSYWKYRSKGKSQRRSTRKNLRKFLSIIEESEGLSRPRRSITLKDFFPKNFSIEIVSCHITSTTEEDAFPSNAMEETPKPENLLPLGINDLLTISREVNDEDLLLGLKLHNRPLYVSGYVREQKLNQILIDNGSAVNILPKSTMNQLGISVEELSNSKLVIQGFNQGAQRAIDTVRLEIFIGDLQASTTFHVIDSRTTYKMLLECPWIHENGIVTSMLHQCFKFYKQGIRKVDADSRPFTKAESHFVDAKFYTKSEDVSEIISTEVPVTKDTFKNEQAMITSKKSNKGDALNNQENGESTIETKSRAPEAEKIATLQKEENFIALLTKIEKGEAKKIEKKDLEAYLPERRTVEGFEPKAYKLMAKVGYDFTTRTELKSVKIFDERSELSPTQKKLQKQGYSIPNSIAGIGYQSSEQVRITDNEPEDEVDVEGCCHVTIEETSDHDIFEEDVEAVPLSLEDGGQSTIDELKEVNLGNFWTRSKGAVQHLAIKLEHRPVKQAQRRFRPELISQIEEEINKLIKAGFIREVKYPTWIANIVPVRKKNGQLRVCVNFRDLNNTCPKDDFPLPIMEIMINSTAGHEALSFMDGSSRYNQIRMALDDAEKTTFRTPKGIYCYKVMPFGLKNAGATYQRAMQRIFDDMLHKHIECYVDDLVVKSKKKCDHLKDLKLVLDRLRKYQLRMNPLKCAFGVTSGKFLGFIVRHRGIEVDHSKINAIQKMPSPKNLHELRRLQGRLAYIRRFISNLAARCQPFQRLMRKDAVFDWDQSCQNAFDSIKKYLFNPSILSAPAAGKPLILYIAAQETSLGALLAQENDKVKGQALADFLADHPVPSNWKLCEDLPDEEVLFVESMEPWIMFFDGAARRSGAGVGILFISPEKHMLAYSFTLEFGIKCIEIFGDSKLIINKLSYQYEVKHQDLKPYFSYARRLMDKFDSIILEHIPRSENKKADALANLATALTVSEDIPINIFLCKKWIVPSIESQYEEADVISVYAIDEEDWRQPIIDYLEHGKPSTDPRIELKYALEEAHSGICGVHQSGPKLQYQLKRMGYYWPTMIHDSMHFAKYCEAYQFHAKFIHQPPEPLPLTIASWPFEAWGLDLVGSITPKSLVGHSYILAGTDYFLIGLKPCH